MSDTFAIELKGVTKVFGQIVANKDVNLQVKKGEILAILGENGSGKTTLMNMLSGIYFPDEGQIYVNGEEVVIKSPRDAFKSYDVALNTESVWYISILNLLMFLQLPRI